MNSGNIYKWTIIERLGVAAMNFAGMIALARLLSPDDFGLLAMVAVLTAVIANLSNCGLSDGLIHKENPTEADYGTVFLFNTALGLFFGIAAIAGAGAVARFFGHEEMVFIMRVFGVCFFFQTMSFVQTTRLRKQLQMKKNCIAVLSAQAMALTLGLVLAVCGYGYKALVATQIVIAFFTFVTLTAVSRWWPRLCWSTRSFVQLFSYGIHLMIAFICNMAGQNINSFVLGKVFPSASAAGFYSQGAKVAHVPFFITEAAINQPFFVLASNEPSKQERMNMVLNMHSLMSTLNMSIALLLVLIAQPAIEVIFGNKWLESAPVLKILAFTECALCMKAVYQTVMKLHGQTRFVRNINFIELAVQIVLLVLFYKQGLLAVTATQLAALLPSLAIYTARTKRLFNLSGRQVATMLIKPLMVPATAFVLAAAFDYILYTLTSSPVLHCIATGCIYAGIIALLLEYTSPGTLRKMLRLVVNK